MPKRKRNNSVGANLAKADAQVEKVRHSLAHLLAAAVLEKFPKAKLGIGPAIDDGFYYDFDLPRNLTPEDLKDIEARMRNFIKEGLSFSGKKATSAVARKTFTNQPFKLDLIKDFVKEKKQLSIYKTGDVFEDLCRGGHVKNTREIDPKSFKLDRLAGAYWKGDEKNKQLQRVYGLAFKTSKELNEYIKQREEAEKRDHKVLGPQLDLFTFSDLVGPGLPLWTPMGTRMRHLLDEFVWSLRKERGYERVEIPHITKKELYETSGHWDKFQDELFHVRSREGHEFVMKPMNCPHHIQILQRKQLSYRDMPVRYANTTTCYRDEQSGELSGIARARSFTQDDAHVFCRQSQVKEEFFKIWDIVDAFYKGVGFVELEVRISGHDPKNFDAYLGTKASWQKAEKALKDIARERKARVKFVEGEAAFYGPKIDFIAFDSLGRERQVATIQLDMNMPDRFDIYCIDEKGKHERLVMIHAAIMGSIERFMSIFIEHTAGAFPVWVSPIQVQVVPVSKKHGPYAKKIVKELEHENIRVYLSDSDETLGKRIREGEQAKIPYLLIVGDKEESSDSVAVRKRGKGDIGAQKLSQFIKILNEEIYKKK
ncbi:MAG: threonine--tRNA ligase [Candidatus Colwellbacteria bacterium CG10_big_fil_rev_8_21_14_0_10_42_22]|uniref:Threonine--tRNA ligase n=1 Tax=Candidatus Colwellbacteria bacterium CG10_big_fil_rev_8_21_14_0_10_42_22 TaxID=1974540 RepID=A0A2H0VF58_9BACT|nr:MAG: threonine--tRNA ligase [Candidatus Colwellbacteria bacterium CG10_big_fil_rev_8_21_14_0_10_42_22]